jgi:hypothetical protein
MLWLVPMLATLGLASTEQSFGQQQSSSGVWIPNQPMDVTIPNAGRTPAGDPAIGEKRLHQLSVVQHKSMVSDTDKLLRLVTDLNAEIGRTNPASLSPEELRKVAEIEKLARSVKDKMRTSVRGTSTFMNMMPPISDPTSGH